jgi:rhodanese-related sulfurtransferase
MNTPGTADLGALNPAAVPSGRPVIVVCRTGRRSAIAAGKLRDAGLDARNLTGGMTAWAQAGLPVRTDDGREGTVA